MKPTVSTELLKAVQTELHDGYELSWEEIDEAWDDHHMADSYVVPMLERLAEFISEEEDT